PHLGRHIDDDSSVGPGIGQHLLHRRLRGDEARAHVQVEHGVQVFIRDLQHRLGVISARVVHQDVELWEITNDRPDGGAVGDIADRRRPFHQVEKKASPRCRIRLPSHCPLAVSDFVRTSGRHATAALPPSRHSCWPIRQCPRTAPRACHNALHEYWPALH
nr:hypothetical protein [Tanacetum cinerariifolium]